MRLEEDRPLLDAFRRGERDALDRVYRTYAEEIASILVHGFAFSSAGRSARFHGLTSRFDIEDLLQEVFTRAFTERARLGYDGLRPYGGYLAGIAKAAVIDRLRSHARWQRRFLLDDGSADAALPHDAGHASDPLEGDIAPTGDPSRDLENAELAALLAEIQASLAPEEAEVFRLRFREGKSLTEVERETGRSPSRVKTLERKLRQRLLDRIWAAGYLHGERGKEGWIARLLAPDEGKVKA